MSSICVATILEWINLSYNASSYATRGSLGASRKNTLRPDLPRAKLFIVTEPQIRTVLTVLLANFSLSLQPRQVHRGEAMPRPSRISPALSASMATPIGLVRAVFLRCGEHHCQKEAKHEPSSRQIRGHDSPPKAAPSPRTCWTMRLRFGESIAAWRGGG